MEFRFVDDDQVIPTAIEHQCEEIFDGDALDQKYNYLVYHFDHNAAYYWARTYLDDIGTVSLHGPFESRAALTQIPGSPDEAVLSFLRRRFRKIQMLQNEGYVPV